MPRKTKKHKQLAHTRASQLPKREESRTYEVQAPTPSVTLSTADVQVKKEQLSLIPKQKITNVPSSFSPESSTHFRHDIIKTTSLTALIVVIELVLYHLMQSGMLAKWIPALKI